MTIDSNLFSIDELFQKTVKQFPRHQAVCDKNQSMSYRELDSLVDDIAASVLRSQTAPGIPVNILMDPGAIEVAAILGVMRARRIANPLDSATPASQIVSMIQSSEAELLLTDSKNIDLARQVHLSGQTIVDVGQLRSGGISLKEPAGPDEPAWLSYSSGTTGEPKGILQTHRSMLYGFGNYLNRTRMSPTDRVAVVHHRYLDAMAPLFSGAAVFIRDLKDLSPIQLVPWLNDQGITVLPIVPTALRVVLRYCAPNEKVESVRLIRSSGESVYGSDAAEIARVFGAECVLLNWLASSEMAIASHAVRADAASSARQIAAGEVLEGISISIVNDQRQTLEPGQAGEIAISGRCLFPGYWKMPDLNTRCFATDPEDTSLRTFFSGDMGKIGEDGALYFTGRKDRMLKVNGYRVEPGEVENLLLNMKGIEEVVVDKRRDSDGEEVLVVYMVTTDDVPPLSRVRQALRDSIPVFMMPSFFYLLPSLPRNRHGKVSLKDLPGVQKGIRSQYNVLEAG